MAEITKEPIIEHFKTDAYYRYLLSTSQKRSGKRSRKDAIEDDAGDLSVLMDAPTKRPRLGRGGGGRGRGGVPGRFHSTDERSHKWGAATITYSTKKDGSTVVQGTCHRLHSHPHAPGRPSTKCRQTFTVTEAHPVEDCERLIKWWIGAAHDFHRRLDHQAKRYGLDEIGDDLAIEGLQPPSDYDSTPEEVAAARAREAARKPRRVGRFRIRAKAAAPDG